MKLQTCNICFNFQLAETLLKKETLRYEEVEALIGPPPHGKKKLVEPTDFENAVSEKPEEEFEENQTDQDSSDTNTSA